MVPSAVAVARGGDTPPPLCTPVLAARAQARRCSAAGAERRGSFVSSDLGTSGVQTPQRGGRNVSTCVRLSFRLRVGFAPPPLAPPAPRGPPPRAQRGSGGADLEGLPALSHLPGDACHFLPLAERPAGRCFVNVLTGEKGLSCSGCSPTIQRPSPRAAGVPQRWPHRSGVRGPLRGGRAVLTGATAAGVGAFGGVSGCSGVLRVRGWVSAWPGPLPGPLCRVPSVDGFQVDGQGEGGRGALRPPTCWRR